MLQTEAFIGLLILIEILQLPHLGMYWKTSNVYFATYSISKVMIRVRFEQIYGFLHLTNNNDQDGDPVNRDKKIFKIRNIADLYYVPQQTITIDEAMIPFKGCLSF